MMERRQKVFKKKTLSKRNMGFISNQNKHTLQKKNSGIFLKVGDGATR